MEQPEVEKSCPSSEDGSQLGRNRSFKSKQLVRSQAIRESTSPPRTISPYTSEKDRNNDIADSVTGASEKDSESSHSDRCTVISNDRLCDAKKQPVEIQITSGAWEAEGESEQRLRTRRWLGHRHHSDSSRDLLSYNPRVACVCGTCACPHCRGRRRKHACPTKQDSGIVCSDDCPDCSDTDHAGPNGDGARKSGSFDSEDQTFYCRCPERKEKHKSLSLSNDFDDKTEPTGPELVNFIKETLNKNPRDRMTLLKIEKELHSLVSDNGRCIVRFPVMTSYGRMLVHRCAALFQLAHHLDHANKNAVLVSKSGTSGGRIPCTSFREWCSAAFPTSPPRHDTLAKSILKRDGSNSTVPTVVAGRSKSLEQREREYERVRRRIFSTDNCSRDESQWAWLAGAPVKLLAPEPPRNRLLKVQSLEGGGTARGAVSKSHSFGGYTTEQPRLLSRQGDLASSSWRLSPSSSGYKTLSLRSSDSVTPSPTGGASPEPSLEGATLVWAVTDMSAVPPGALVIHPQTGRPLTNPDGSLYHFDPNNPPAIQGEFQIDINNEKRRGKLEKQHSFIDTDCECPATDECRTKCYCECRRHDDTQVTNEKSTLQKPKSASNPTSPVKNRYEKPKPVTPEPKPQEKTVETSPKHEKIEPNNQNNQKFDQNNQKFEPQIQKDPPKVLETTNHTPSNPRFESPANQRPAFEPTNQRPFELASQRPVFDNRYERFDIQNQRVVKTSEEMYQQSYIQGFRNEDMISPQTMMNYPPPEVAEMQNMMQAKVTPIPMPDPNMRPMSLTNMMYPSMPPNAYPFLNTCRIDQPLQPQMYQPVLQQPEEQKQLTSSPHNDNTFRIDPSYPYAADLNACGACEPLQPRGYNVPYGQVDVPPGMVPPYTIPNVLIQPPIQPYPYQEQVPVQWPSVQPVPVSSPKVMLHDIYPLVYPNVYPPYNVVYPQVIPQQYPFVQPVYPIMEKQAEIRRNSLPRPKRNPSRHDEEKYDEMKKDERQNDIAMKIQQIKEQMAQMNTKDRRNEWRRRNSGSGILGSYPVHYNGRVVGRPPNEDARLSTAAQAIVNSIRNMQVKNNYHEPRRFEPRPERQEFRPRRYERDERRDQPRACLVRQMSPGTWCRRSPGPLPPAFNQPRRPHPDSRNGRR